MFGGLVFFGIAEVSARPFLHPVGFQTAAPRVECLSWAYHLLQPFIFSGLFSGPSDKGRRGAGEAGRKAAARMAVVIAFCAEQ